MSLIRRRIVSTASTAAAGLVIAGCAAQIGTAPGAAPAASAAPSAAPAPPPIPTAATTAVAPAPPPAAATPQVSGRGAEVGEADVHRHHHHGGILSLIAMSLSDLDLPADQKAAVEKIRADVHSKMEKARGTGKDFLTALADGVAAGKVDRAKVDATVARLAAQAAGGHEEALAAIDQLHATLHADQRAKLVDDLQSHWEKWKEAQGRDEEDDPQHRSGHLVAFVRDLNLTKEQATKIKESFRGLMKASRQDHAHKEVQQYLDAFATAFKSDTFDAKKVAGSKDVGGRMTRWGATRLARFVEAAAPILTPEQRTKLAQRLRDQASREEP